MFSPPSSSGRNAMSKGGEARNATVYWCLRCDVQSDGLHHFCERGPALFPQLDEYTKCHVIHVEVTVPDV